MQCRDRPGPKTAPAAAAHYIAFDIVAFASVAFESIMFESSTVVMFESSTTVSLVTMVSLVVSVFGVQAAALRAATAISDIVTNFFMDVSPIVGRPLPGQPNCYPSPALNVRAPYDGKKMRLVGKSHAPISDCVTVSPHFVANPPNSGS
jgi:hypothetical protein